MRIILKEWQTCSFSKGTEWIKSWDVEMYKMYPIPKTAQFNNISVPAVKKKKISFLLKYLAAMFRSPGCGIDTETGHTTIFIALNGLFTFHSRHLSQSTTSLLRILSSRTAASSGATESILKHKLLEKQEHLYKLHCPSLFLIVQHSLVTDTAAA